MDEFVALDTNQYVLALRRDPRFPHCAALLFQRPSYLIAARHELCRAVVYSTSFPDAEVWSAVIYRRIPLRFA